MFTSLEYRDIGDISETINSGLNRLGGAFEAGLQQCCKT